MFKQKLGHKCLLQSIHNSPKVELSPIPSTEDWIDKMRNIHTIEYYSVEKGNKVLMHVTTWINIENIPSERNQTQKTTHTL